MTPSTFELLSQLLSPSEHIPKGNAFGRRPIEARKQIAVAVWALANQETCRQLSDRFDITMSSVSRCTGRVVRALVWMYAQTLFSGQEVHCNIGFYATRKP